LRFIATELEIITRERNELREKLREKELAILEFKERDELLKSTIATATKMSEKVKQDAERESRLILGDAKQQAEMIVRDARESLKRIFQEVSDLKKIRMQYENNLRALVHSHLQMLEQGQRLMPDPNIEINKYTGPQAQASKDMDAIRANVTDAVQRSVTRQIEL
jgi:cell division initiation protein